MIEFPVGWERCQLGDLLEHIQAGKSVRCDEHAPEGDQPGLVKISAVTWGRFNELESKTLLTTEGLDPRNKIHAGDLLISRANTLELVGAPVIVDTISKNLYLSDKVLRLDVPEALKPWVLVCLKSKMGRDQIERLATGNQISMRNISQDSLKLIELPLPPAAEQKRITQKLEALLTQADTLKARIDAIPALLKTIRQSTLSAAVSGRMTGRMKLSTAAAQAYQSPIVFRGSEQGTEPEGWRWEKLVNVATLESGHTPRKSVPAYWSGGDVPWISLQDIRAADGKETFSTKLMPTELGIAKSSARLLPKGTVCFSRDISVGFVTLMGRPMATTQHFANWICGEKLLPKYLMYAFMAGRGHLVKSGQGSTVKTIYMPALRELRLLLPPLAEQVNIVRRIEELFLIADQLEAKVERAKRRVDVLSQSLIAKAFRGELVSQDQNEEPASVLLERIRAYRATAPMPRRGRKAASI